MGNKGRAANYLSSRLLPSSQRKNGIAFVPMAAYWDITEILPSKNSKQNKTKKDYRNALTDCNNLKCHI